MYRVFSPLEKSLIGILLESIKYEDASENNVSGCYRVAYSKINDGFCSTDNETIYSIHINVLYNAYKESLSHVINIGHLYDIEEACSYINNTFLPIIPYINDRDKTGMDFEVLSVIVFLYDLRSKINVMVAHGVYLLFNDICDIIDINGIDIDKCWDKIHEKINSALENGMIGQYEHSSIIKMLTKYEGDLEVLFNGI